MRFHDLKMSREMKLFIASLALVSIGLGLSDSVFSNYFKDAYRIEVIQRGFIEFPRELPGLLCVLVIALLAPLGDFRSTLIAQMLSITGLVMLGLFTPPFAIMLIFLFINSMGMHMFMPLSDSIGMRLAEPDCIGRRMGQYNAIRSLFGCVAALIVFFGFRYNWLSFTTKIKSIFLIGAAAFLIAFILLFSLSKIVHSQNGTQKRNQLVFRYEYRYYYTLAILQGVQKQITLVYGSWVLIDLLNKKADTLSILYIISSFLGIFFMSMLGHWVDRFGIKRILYLDALTFIIIYVVFGLTVSGITRQSLASFGWPVFIVYALFILDRMSMQISMIKIVYLRAIARDPSEITSTLSLGTSMDHVVSILSGIAGGFIWANWGCQWVFFIAAALSLGNLYVAWRVHLPQTSQIA